MTVIRKANLKEFPEFDGKALRIVELRAENIKKIKLVEITPRAGVNIISGPNGSGKSSVLDAIMYALRGASGISSHTVRKGTERAVIRLDLGQIVVTRKITAGSENKNGYLEVWTKDNQHRYRGGQQLLDALLGAISFDPLEFMRMDAKAQLETLRSLAPVEIDGVSIEEFDALTKADYDERRQLKKESDALAVRVGEVRVPDGLPPEPVDVETLAEELQRAGESNATREKLLAQAKEMADTAQRAYNGVNNARRRAADIQAQIEQLTRQAAELDRDAEELHAEAEKLERARGAMTIPEEVPTEPIQTRIAEAAATNRAIETRARREQLAEEKRRTDARVEELSERREQRLAERTAAIAAAPIPVKGLGYGEGEVTYNDLPFDQLSDGEQIKISVQLAMASNPHIRVLRIKDGSLLDDKSLAQIEEMAAEHEYQMWIERVNDTGKVGVRMEDGEVVDDGE